MMLRDFLSKLKWDHREDLSTARISYVDRAKDTRGNTIRRIKSVKGSSIVELEPGFMTIKMGDDISHVPFHRVEEVRDSNGKVRWARNG